MRQLLGWVWVAILAYLVVRIGITIIRAPATKRLNLLAKHLAIILVAYLSTLAVLLILERSLIFHGIPASVAWTEPSTLKAEDVFLPLRDGVNIHAWWCPTPNAIAVLHYSHGNAGNLSGRCGIVAALQQRGFSVFIYDYPGYGRSTGTPDEAACYAAGEAGYRWLIDTQQVAPDDVVLWGKSLGAAVATDLALRLNHRALVLFSPFTSIPDMAQHLFPFFPARWLVRTQFDNVTKLTQYKGRVLVGWYDEDPLVPPSQSRQVLAACQQARERHGVSYPGKVHGGPPDAFLDLTRDFAGRR
jgi:pimeloyl-ACP methyl ester carboxylesterase